jgi:hypothetical protein
LGPRRRRRPLRKALKTEARQAPVRVLGSGNDGIHNPVLGDEEFTTGSDGPGLISLDVGERLMSITDLSDMLGVPIHTLHRWRHKGGGPGRLSDWATCEVPSSNR